MGQDTQKKTVEHDIPEGTKELLRDWMSSGASLPLIEPRDGVYHLEDEREASIIDVTG